MFLLICMHLEAPVTEVCQHTGYQQRYCLWCATLKSSNSTLVHEHLFPLSGSWAAVPRELLRAVQFHWGGFRTWISHHFIQHFWHLMHFWKCISSGLLFHCSLHCSPCWLGVNCYQVCSVPGGSTSMLPNALCPLLWISRYHWFWLCLKQSTKNYSCPSWQLRKQKHREVADLIISHVTAAEVVSKIWCLIS